MRRQRKAKIIATLGPASSDYEQIKALFIAGADVFRLNFSHGEHESHAENYKIIRRIEQEFKRPIGILLDLQGPKLRIGTFSNTKISLKPGQTFLLDLDSTPGNNHRVCMPHPEIFQVLKENVDLLLDDGKVRLKITKSGPDFAETIVMSGTELSNRKGVNVPDVVLPIDALTKKDIIDLKFGLELGVDWVALSFVQQPNDLIMARELVGKKVKLIAKIEKPMAIQYLQEIVTLSDAVMVARGDLGVEMPAEDVPVMQRQIIRTCRSLGKPVIVATQMLDSMVHTPTPTRAEASDVATAVYDGVDAVMLSAESASGDYPIEAVSMMDRIIQRTEKDPFYQKMLDDSYTLPSPTVSDAVTTAARSAVGIIGSGLMVTFTETGRTAFHAARERPHCDILALTPVLKTSRQLTLVWGAHPALTDDIFSIGQMVETASAFAKQEGFAQVDDYVVITAGVPFGQSGGTNMIRIEKVS
jgi:pyruvate kinase